MRILCVDDDPDIRAMLELAFSRHADIEATILSKGLDVLDHSRRGPWDLFLLDAEMPGLDGYGACRRLKANPETASVPVIFLTARTQPKDTERALELGAASWIGKPFDPLTIVAQLRSALAA
jgi:DNA-binding response OmpR family regulator